MRVGSVHLRNGQVSLHPQYSIVIPAYNESTRPSATPEKVLAYVHAQKWDAEVIVINDGSLDSTADIVRTFAEKDPALRLVESRQSWQEIQCAQRYAQRMRTHRPLHRC